VQFAKRGNIIEPGVGARVGNHDEPGPNENSAAIGHGQIFRRQPVVATRIAMVRCIAKTSFPNAKNTIKTAC
jgi:hypothetical protein